MENGVLSILVDTDNWRENCCKCLNKFKVDELELDVGAGLWRCPSCVTAFYGWRNPRYKLRRLLRLAV